MMDPIDIIPSFQLDAFHWSGHRSFQEFSQQQFVHTGRNGLDRSNRNQQFFAMKIGQMAEDNPFDIKNMT